MILFAAAQHSQNPGAKGGRSKKTDAEAVPNTSIGSNILSTASSLAMLGTAAVLLITRKNGKDS